MEEFEMSILDPGSTHFSLGPGGVLELRVQGGRFYPRVRVYRSYPLSRKAEFISVRDADRNDLPEIGLISDLARFPAETQEIITSELDKRYFAPLITRIVSIRESRDRLEWDVVTTKGLRRFVVKSPFDNLRPLGDGRLLITDVYRCRYEIEDCEKLPADIKNVLSKYIYL